MHPVFSARAFDFDGLSELASLELTVTEPIDVSEFSEATLTVRGHEGSIATSETIEVAAYAAAPSAEDPSNEFRSSSALAVVTLEGPLTIATADTFLGGAVLTGELGSFVTVTVRATKNPPGDCNAVLSADLVLRKRSRTDIGGSRIVALPRTAFDYTSLGSSETESLALLRALDVSDYRTGYLALRVHERAIDSAASLVVRIQGALRDPGEPDADFVVPSPGNEHSFTISSGTTSELQTVRLSSNFGPFLHVVLEAHQSQSGGSLSAAISLDFVGQE